MKFLTLEVKNFRQHRSITLDFSGPRGDFVVLKGKNGAGKTNLLNSITWCLYGKTLEDKETLAPSLLNQSAYLELQNGDSADVSVSITVEVEGGLKGVVTRTASFTRENDSVLGKQTKFEVLTEDKTLTGFQSETEPLDWIEANFPSRFSPYFLFDGEKLDRFFRETESKYIKGAVLEIAQIDLLGRLVSHLEAVSSELVRVAANSSGTEGAQLAESLTQKRKELQKLQEHMEELEDGRETLRGVLANIQKKQGDLAAITGDFEKQRDYEAKSKSAADRSRSGWADLYKWALANAPLAFAAESFEAVRVAVALAQDRGTLPPAWKPDAITKLLEEGTCICGCGLESNSDGRRQLEGLIEKFTETSEIGAQLQELDSQIRVLSERLSNSNGLAEKVVEAIDSADEDHSHFSKMYNQVTQRLTGHDDRQIALLAEQRDKALQQSEKQNQSIGRTEVEIRDLTKDIEAIEAKIDKEVQKDKRSQDAMREAQFSKAVLGEAKSLYSSLNDVVRDQVALNLDSQFKQMIWKKDFFEQVTIDPEFRISVLNNRGFEILGDLSAGERECLAFAFSLTLSQVARFVFPMVVDTPMGRLSPEVQEYVSQVLVESTAPTKESPAHQIILLMTETEYNSEVAKILGQRTPKVLEIDFDIATSESRLREIS